MTEKVSTLEVRQRLGDILNRVALRHDEFIIERKGTPLAALVPIERLKQIRDVARRYAVEFLERQKTRAGDLDDDQTMKLALEAQRWARGSGRKTVRRRK